MCPLATCDVAGAGSLELSGREARWILTNNGDADLYIERIIVDWPTANSVLTEIKRDGDAIHKGDFTPDDQPVVTDSGWEGDLDKRRIKHGESDTLKFKFDDDAVGPLSDYSITVEFNGDCEITFEPAPQSTSSSDFTCDRPIDELTMEWVGANDILVTAWKGDVGSNLLAETQPVSVNGALSVDGYAGSPNDVTWEIFDAAGTKLGESVFHLSCSDNDMDGPEDCNKPQGDGKSNDADLINDWILKGMIDESAQLICP